MPKAPRIACTYDVDEATGLPVFIVSRAAAKACDAYFVHGQRYYLEEIDDVQRKQDMAFHARFRELFDSLPEHMDKTFPSSDSFRGFCLIRCNFYRESTIVFESVAGAKRNLSTLAGMASTRGNYAITTIVDSMVVSRVSKSQRVKHAEMDREELVRSYKAVEEYAEAIVKGEAHV